MQTLHYCLQKGESCKYVSNDLTGDAKMQSKTSTILVVGATGKFARLVTPELLRREARPRALVRSSSQGEAAVALGAAEFAIGDLRNAASLRNALEGADGVFHIGPAFSPDEAAMGVAIVEAAERAGVKKFVFSSVIQPTNTALKNHASKIPVEEALYSSRLTYTILQPANFMQNIAVAWPTIVRSGQFAEPFPANVKVARVDYRDVAEVAAIALRSDHLSYATLELAAGMYDRTEITSAMSEALGKRIEPMELSFDDWVVKSNLPYADRELDLLARIHRHYSKFGLGGNPLTLAAALQRQPRSLEDFFKDLVQARPAAAAQETA
jgi:uncharacterized protein YbjT (DUF2867 family)